MRTANSFVCSQVQESDQVVANYLAQSPVLCSYRSNSASVSCLKESNAKSGRGEEVGMTDRSGMSSPCGLKLTEDNLSAITSKVVEKLTAGKAAPKRQGEKVNRASFMGRTHRGVVCQTGLRDRFARQVCGMAFVI